MCVAGSCDYLYRMRALDAVRDTGKVNPDRNHCFVLFCQDVCIPSHYHSNTSIVLSVDLPFRQLGGTSTAVTGKRFRTWLLQLRNSNCLFRDSQISLIDTVLDGYNKARHGAEVSVCV